MIANHFDYHAPRTLNEATALLSETGEDAAVLGGGTWLVTHMTFGRMKPKVVLDPRHLGLEQISMLGESIEVGARVSYGQLLQSKEAQSALPLLTKMCSGITGGPQIAGHGTLGGSACYGNPSSDVPACLVALEAVIRLASVRGVREVPAADFFEGAFQTARRPDEILLSMRFPKPSEGVTAGYRKLKFGTGSWPILTAACVTSGAKHGSRRHRIVIGAATGQPVLFQCDDQLPASERDVQIRALIVDGWSDEFASGAYRRQVAPSIATSALRESVGAA
jgi:CO/xanthine dehydrogenase FAD-binding subunit